MPVGKDPVCCVLKPVFDSITSFVLKSNIIYDNVVADNLLWSSPTIVAESSLSISVSCKQNSGNPKLEVMSDFSHLSGSTDSFLIRNLDAAKKSWIDDNGKSLLIQLQGVMEVMDAKPLMLDYEQIVWFTCYKVNSSQGKWIPAASEASSRKIFLNHVASFPRMPDWWNEVFILFLDGHPMALTVAFLFAVATALFNSLPSFKDLVYLSEQVDGICENPHVQSLHSQKQEDMALLTKEILLLSQQAAEFSDVVYLNKTSNFPPGKKLYGFYPKFLTGKWRKDQAFVAKADGVCYGVFQGTIPKILFWEDITARERVDFLRNWGENFKPLNGQKCGCFVRRGFLDMYNREYIADFCKSVNKCVHSCARGNCELVLTGHSQGGGIAMVAAIDLHVHNPYVIMFGGPPAVRRPCKYINKDRIYQFKNTLVNAANHHLRYDIVTVLPGADQDIGRHFLLGYGGESVAHYASPPPNIFEAILDEKSLKDLFIHMFDSTLKKLYLPIIGMIATLKDDLVALLNLIGSTNDAHDLVDVPSIMYCRGYILQLKELYPPSSNMQYVQATGFDIDGYCREDAECISNMCLASHCALHNCDDKWDEATFWLGGVFDGNTALGLHEDAYEKAQSIPGLSKVLGGGADAFQKCYWNCIMVIKFVKTASKPQDFSNLFPRCFRMLKFEKMDLHNSKVGQVYGQRYAKDNSECKKFCLDGVSNGKLHTIPIQ
jgi:hypothetical protein